MSESTEQASAGNAAAPKAELQSLLKPRRIAVEVIGFLIGAALLTWCIWSAVEDGDWRRLASADPKLILGMAGCSIISLLINGAIFWIVIRPVKPLRLRDMELLNLVTSVLNYAPIRAGLIARVAYHLRVDRLSLLTIGAWLAAIACTLGLVMGAVLAAVLLRGRLDWITAAIIGVLIVGGALITRSLMHVPLVQAQGRGLHVMLRDNAALWGALGLRLIDIAAWTGRMGCAIAILGLPLDGSQVALLAVVAIAMSLVPLGRLGYREAGVALFASYLSMSNDELGKAAEQLALIESAGEAIVAIPLGALALLWYRHRWRLAAQG